MDLPPDMRLRWETHSAELDSEWLQVVSEKERERIQSFGSDKRRREFLAGRVAARRLLAEQLGQPPQAITLEMDVSGAVKVADAPHYVSITHAGPHAVAVAGERRLGVDMEQVVNRRADLHQFLCGPEEEAMFSDWPLSHNNACILCWTLKEATLKAMRTGLRLSPKKVRLEIDIAAGRGKAVVESGEVWQLRFVERESCYLSIAFEGKDYDIGNL